MNGKLRNTFLLTVCIFLCGSADIGVVCRAAHPAPDLPVVELKATDESLPLILYVSGDGGYNAFSQGLLAKISSKGYGILALDARSYFWKAKTPQQLASDMASLLSNHLLNRHSQQIIVMGYSFGASVIPFMLNRFPGDLLDRVKMGVCISPGRFADFEVTLSTLLNNTKGNKNYPVVDESRKLTPLPIYFLFGQEENAETTRFFADAGVAVAVLPGNHDYGNDIGALSKKLLDIFRMK